MKKKLLIVDDAQSWGAFNKNLIETYFEGKFDITVVNSAYDARYFSVVNSEIPFDLIITDLQMENICDDMTAGEWLIEQIREIPEYGKSAKILIISGMPNIKMVAEFYNAEYISKTSLVSNNYQIKIAIENMFPYINK